MDNKKLDVKFVNSLLKEAKSKFPTGEFFKYYNDRDKNWIIYTRNLDLYNSEEFECYIENITDSPYDEVCFLYSSVEKHFEEKDMDKTNELLTTAIAEYKALLDASLSEGSYIKKHDIFYVKIGTEKKKEQIKKTLALQKEKTSQLKNLNKSLSITTKVYK